MNRYCYSIGFVLAFVFAGCKDLPTPQFDPEMPAPGGQRLAFRGAEDVHDIVKDRPIRLVFDTDKRFFHGVADAVRLNDSIVATVNQLTNEIFLFDTNGNFVRSIARAGNGPGEFNDVNSLTVLGRDTIVAFDRQTRKVALFTSDGTFVNEYRIAGPPQASSVGRAELAGALGEHRFLIWTQAMPTAEEMNLPPNKPAAISEVPFIFDAHHQTTLTIGKFPGTDLWVTDASGTERNYGRAPFGRRTWFGTMNGKAAVLRNTERALRLFSDDGSTYAVIEGTWSARDVTREDREQFMATWFTGLRKEPYWNKLKARTEQAFPALTPYVRDVIFGTDGIIWIELYASCCGGERLFIGYDYTGVAVGRLTIPLTDRVLHIGEGVLIATRPEEFGTVTVYMQRYRNGDIHRDMPGGPDQR